LKAILVGDSEITFREILRIIRNAPALKILAADGSWIRRSDAA
jgi:hypothetical protein